MLGRRNSAMQKFSSSPLNLRERLRGKTDARLETIPLFNVLLVVVLLTLTGSSFIFAPGLAVALDGSAAGTETAVGASAGIVLPRAEIPLVGAETSAVLTVKSDKMFIYAGHIYESLDDVFARMDAPAAGTRGTLLVKLDRAVSVQGLFKIAELAGKAGFGALQVAGESPTPHSESTR